MGSCKSKFCLVVFGERTPNTCDPESEIPQEHSLLPQTSELELITSHEGRENIPTPA
jgi:hypothetical protein